MHFIPLRDKERKGIQGEEHKKEKFILLVVGV